MSWRDCVPALRRCRGAQHDQKGPFTYRLPKGVQKIALHRYGHSVIIGHPLRTLLEESPTDDQRQHHEPAS